MGESLVDVLEWKGEKSNLFYRKASVGMSGDECSFNLSVDGESLA